MTAKKRKAAPWESRIVGEGWEAPDQLLANPDNVRIHPRHQQEAIEKLLDRVGWIQRVIVNKRTGNMLDGHARVAIAISREEQRVPVLYVDLSPEEEALMLAAYDAVSALAATDDAKYDEVLALVPDDDRALALMTRGLRRADKKLVQFEAKPHLEVVVECADETQQSSLIAKLTDEGYTCRGR